MPKSFATISISDKELQRAIKKLKRAESSATQRFRDAVNESTTNIHSKAVLAAPANRGRLRQSIHMRTLKRGLTGEVYSDAFYAPYVEFGTKSKFQITEGVEGLREYAAQFKGSAGRKSNQTIFDAIRIWALRTKKIPLSAVYPVAVHIMKFGTRAQPFLFPAAKFERAMYYRNIRKIIEEHSAR